MANLDDILAELSQPGASGLPSRAGGVSPLAPSGGMSPGPGGFPSTTVGTAAPLVAPRTIAEQSPQSTQQSAQGSPLLGNLPDNLKKLQSKWVEIGPAVREQFDDSLIQSIIDMDSDRVTNGGQPLTREQTIKALLSARDNTQATPQADRNPLNVGGNAIKDLGAIVKSIPRLPQAMLGEVSALTRFGSEVQKNKDAGQTGLQALANAPGIRLLPGSFLVGNAQTPAEFLKHPLFTAMDVLPIAKGLAKTTNVAKVAETAALEAGRTPNALSAVLTRSLDDAGNLVRNKLGRGIEHVMTETKPGRTAAQIFGADSRDMMRMLEQKGAHLQAIRDGVVQPANDVEKFMARSADLRGKYGFDNEKIVALTDRAQMGDFTSLAPDELAFLDEARELGHAYGKSRVDEDMMRMIDVDGTPEFYPRAQADAITQARGVAESTRRIEAARREMLQPTGTTTLEQFRRGLEQAAESPNTRLGNLEAQTIIRTMQAYGHDVSTFTGKANRLSSSRPASSFLAQFDEAATAGKFATPESLMPVNELVAQLKGAKSDILADRLATAIRDGNTKGVTSALDSIMSRIEEGRPPVANDPRFVRSVRAARDIRKLDGEKLTKYTDKRVATFSKRAEKLADKTAPARFGPLIAKNTRVRAGERLIPAGATPEQAAVITRAIEESRWGTVAAQVGKDVDDIVNLYKGIDKEVASEWRALKAAGADPIFVHRVARGRASQVAAPRIGPVAGNISQDLERAHDFSPGVDDITVALTHQGMEILSRKASEAAIDDIVRKYGIKESDLREQYADRAQAMTGGATNFDQALRDLLDRRFEAFNPDQRGYNWGGAKLDKYRQEQYFIPKPLADNLHKIASPKGAISAAMDPITNTFRMSVVGLSPRTQLYNVLGGATMLLGQTSPKVAKFYQQARRWVKDPSLIDNEVLAATIGSSKRSFESSEFVRADAATKYAFGRTMGRFLEESQVGKAGAAGAGGVRRVMDWMMDKNALVDDQYRVMAYLYGHDKALTKGLSEDVARRSGETLMRKTMMDWTGMTPIERTVFKSIFPFYGFMSHALKYVSRYPVDHPLRAQVLAAFAQSEEADLGALPGQFLSMLSIGDPDSNNRQNWLNTAALNPFGDVANMFTVAGFLSSTNPVLTTAFEQAGLTRGQAELYPTLRYDPETGRLAARHANPLLGLIENTIPQTALISSLLGANAQYSQMLRTNPAAATRFLLSNSGIPITHRQYNMGAEIAKAELARARSAELAKSSALETGDWTEAMRYPSLQPMFEQLDSLPADVLQQFRPPDKAALSAQIQQVVNEPTSPAARQQSTGGI